jgi:site-specific DNA-methyltransferase (adenine-specific)
MKENIQKSTLSFSCSKKMEWLRTPKPIWDKLSKEYNFTVDICASDKNHLLPKYYTKENSAFNYSWANEVAYIHPLFDSKIGRFVEKAFHTKPITAVFLLPASTHTKYFHEWFYHNPNCEITFLRLPKGGHRFGLEDGSDHQAKIGYIKGLMICVIKNAP